MAYYLEILLAEHMLKKWHYFKSMRFAFSTNSFNFSKDISKPFLATKEFLQKPSYSFSCRASLINKESSPSFE
jgi:hypothetical protein